MTYKEVIYIYNRYLLLIINMLFTNHQYMRKFLNISLNHIHTFIRYLYIQWKSLTTSLIQSIYQFLKISQKIYLHKSGAKYTIKSVGSQRLISFWKKFSPMSTSSLKGLIFSCWSDRISMESINFRSTYESRFNFLDAFNQICKI